MMKQKTELIKLDALKAFDRVEWTYQFSRLQNLSYGDKLTKLMAKLYGGSNVIVRTNGTNSVLFQLHRVREDKSALNLLSCL